MNAAVFMKTHKFIIQSANELSTSGCIWKACLVFEHVKVGV